MAELVNENKLGIAKGSPIEDAVEANFKGETTEIGLYSCGGSTSAKRKAILR